MTYSVFNTPYDSTPLSQLSADDYLPEIKKAIQQTELDIHKIAQQKSVPTFKNTIEALCFTGEKLNRLTSALFNLNSAETNSVIQKQTQQVAPLLAEFQNNIRLNSTLFKRIKRLYQQLDKLNLTTEQKTLLVKTYKDFLRNGSALSESQKKKLRQIDKDLALLSLQFGENLLSEIQNYQLHITDEAMLSGLSQEIKNQAQEKANQKQLSGWIFTLDFPTYNAVMTYAENRELRKTLFLDYNSKCFNSKKFDNQSIILQITQLRQERAKLLGYDTYAHFVLENRMAKNADNVLSFLNELLEKALPVAKKELESLSSFAKKHSNINRIEKWDVAFYSEKLKNEILQLDDEKLKPYFELNTVVNGFFTIANKLYNLSFQKTDDVEVYHPDVSVYKVYDRSEFIGLLYTDFHPREGKRSGAWMTSFKEQRIEHNENFRPHVSIVCNFTPPSKKTPSLLTFNEVTTLFHEMGHALHGLLSQVHYPTLSGTNVLWDFVELPSQIMENWCYEPKALQLFARHYQTKTVLPKQYIDNIKKSSQFMEGLQTLRQLGFGFLDLFWHNTPDISKVTDIKKMEDEVLSKTDLFPQIDSSCISCSFSHIFQGGYASGYYSYKWAEVLDADAFEVFQKRGIFNSEVAQQFKTHILSKGGSDDPMELYLKFRKREPSVEALLKRSGITLS